MNLLDPRWFVFRLKLAEPTEAQFLVAYGCPDCGALIDWRRHAQHLRFHGIDDDELIAALVKQQEVWAKIDGAR